MAQRTAFRQYALAGIRITNNELGRGSYAVVLELDYRGLKCAGKKLYPILHQQGIGHAARRYLDECHLLSQTRHPNIVQFLGVFFEEGSEFPILVMEYLPTNLTSCLERYGVLPDEINYSILHGVSLGLSHLHGLTPIIIHRDLSSNNVLLSNNMSAKISDLGVARILNLTPLQVSRMTETPGTPAYMPPEVMVADPHYDTSVDVFSIGVMMVHTLTAEWPLPKVGPNRVDPTNPDQLIPVSEAKRREEFLRKIGQDHPLMDVIMSCLKNNPRRRPRAEEIVQRMGDLALQYPPSFENRFEMLQRISAVSTEMRELEEAIVRKDSSIDEKQGEIERLSEESRQQKEENENEKEQIREECENENERIQLAHSVQTEQLQLQNENLTNQLEVTNTIHKTLVEAKDTHTVQLTAAKDTQIAQLETQKIALSGEVEQQIANVTFLQNKVATNTTQISQLESQIATLNAEVEQQKTMVCSKQNEIASKEAALSASTATIASGESVLVSKEVALEKKEATIQGLNDQLTRTRDYLTSKPQPMQVKLSFSQCADAPMEMYCGQATVINDKVYYGGGECDDDDKYCVHCFNQSRDVWSTLPRLPVSRFGLGQVKGQLVTVGGIKMMLEESHSQSDESDYEYSLTNELYVFDDSSQNWKQSIPPMSTARDSPAVLSHPSCLVVAGGELPSRDKTNIHVVEIYNINTSQWNKTDKLPQPCSDLSGALLNNTVYLMGGWDGVDFLNTVYTAPIDKLMSNSVPVDQPIVDSNDSEHDSVWKAVANTPSNGPSAVVVSGMILAVGGTDSPDWSDYTPTKGVHAYSPSMDSWVHIGDLPSPVGCTVTVSLSPTEFIVIGGIGEYRQRLSTVHKVTLQITIP